MSTFRLAVLLWGTLILSLLTYTMVSALPYPVVYLSSPRPGGDPAVSKMPDAVAPLNLEPGTDLMLLPANSTTPVVLKAGGNGAVLDPFISYDGAHVYYSYCPDMRPSALNAQRFNLPRPGCNIRKLTFATGVDVELVGQSFWQPSGLVAWSTQPDIAVPAGTNYLGYGIMHMSPVEMANGDLVFVSNANGHDIVNGYMRPNPQLFMRYADTGTIEQLWYAPTGTLHPAPLSATGELSFATLENAFKFGKPQRWGIWAMLPNGQAWRPLYSATMSAPTTLHFHTECGGNLTTTAYYFAHNWGLGSLLSAPLIPPSQPAFGSPNRTLNPAIPTGNLTTKYPYSPTGLFSPAPMFHPFDNAAHQIGGVYTGKIGFPWCAPGNTLLVSYSPGPVNHHGAGWLTPAAQLGIFTMPTTGITHQSALVPVVDAPDRNEFMARAVVPYAQIYGVATPLPQPTRPPNAGTVHPALPAGTPYALIGTSSVYNRESAPGQYPTNWKSAYPVYSIDTNTISNRSWQGGDTYDFPNSAIHALRILVQAPVAHLSYGPQASGYAVTRTFEAAHGNERLWILGEVPLRKTNGSGQPILDPQGNPDTSFLAKVPADVAFTFQLVDAAGMVLTQSATWHQVKPGEARWDCGGCHAHNSTPLAFASTVAGQPGYVPTDLTVQQPTATEFHADVEPILTARCSACHNAVTPSGNLDLTTTTLVGSPPSPRNYAVLAKDQGGTLAGPPPIGTYVGRSSRYVAPFAAAESLLAWAASKQRLDGIANSLRPTETIPGDVTSLQPPGARPQADIDYSPTMHTAHASVQLTGAELRTLYQWIDTGMPRDVVPTLGWKADELRPTIGFAATATTIYIGVHDVGSGWVPVPGSTFVVSRNGISVVPGPAGSDGRFALARVPGTWVVQVTDQAGNTQMITRQVP
jgi:hypothetical protein